MRRSLVGLRERCTLSGATMTLSPYEAALSPAPDGKQQDEVLRFLKPAELLLVDDDADGAEILAEAFQQEGYKVRMAGDGHQGLASLDEGFPDLVVLDVEMPSLDGPGMVLQMFVRDLGREKIPILLCSGVLNLSGVASRVGTPYFLAKPYTLDAMLDLVAKALEERTPPSIDFATRSP
jgi:DNA-binding NtrC family response regulator